MENQWASEHLQAIRTLMERSAVYRRALAPVMIVSGTIGVAASIGACQASVVTSRTFCLLWLGAGATALLASFLLVRRQALKESEPFWSPPTRRVTSALLPAFLLGLLAGLHGFLHENSAAAPVIATLWVGAYGCALHAAGFFMQRGIRLFSWAFILAGGTLLLLVPSWPPAQTVQSAHMLMGAFFGILHLAYGIYLYFTERKGRTS